MKKFEEYTLSEKENAISKGGQAKKELEKALNKFIDEHMEEFTAAELDVINTSDPISEVFGTCESVQDIKDIISNY